MNYEQFNDKQKNAISIIKNWGENLKKEDVTRIYCKCDECRSDFRYSSYDDERRALADIQTICFFLNLSFEEKQDVLEFVKSKNFWLKFDLQETIEL